MATNRLDESGLLQAVRLVERTLDAEHPLLLVESALSAAERGELESLYRGSEKLIVTASVPSSR